jgi:FlaA1/EpsC-like NDP-sugar epimerase
MTAPVASSWSALGRKVRFEKYILFCVDLLLAAAGFCLAFVLRTGPAAAISEPGTLLTGLAFFVPICAIAFPVSGLYNRHWRYASLHDLMAISRAVLTALAIFVPTLFLFTRLEEFPRSVAIMQVFILILFLGGVRLIFRIDEFRNVVFSFLGTPEARKLDRVPVLLVGAGSSGDHYLRALGRDPNAVYHPVGFLDDDPAVENHSLRGVKVLGKIADFESVLVKLKKRGRTPQRVIFTNSEMRENIEMSQWLIDTATRHGLAVSSVPSPTELRDPTHESQIELRPIQITDLLERPQNRLDRDKVAGFLFGRRVVVTGAGGSIGSELVQQIAEFSPAEIVLIDNCEFNLYAIDRELAERFPDVTRFVYLCDIRVPYRVDEIFDRHSPDLVFNAAALKHVPMVELNPCEGLMTNVIGTRNVAEAAQRCNVGAFVQISTDKAVDSTSVMGATKRIAELYCQALDLEAKDNCRTRFMTVRFGNVLGSSGSLIPLFQRQLAKGGPLTVTDRNMTRFFMTIREAVELTLQTSAHGVADNSGQGQIFVLDMGEPVKIIDIATRMIRLAGLTPGKDIDIEIIGCRPGEKLYEELFDQSEERIDSSVPGVFGALPTPLPLPFLRERITQLRYLARTGNVIELYNVMREIMPRYEPDAIRRKAESASRAAKQAERKQRSLSRGLGQAKPKVHPLPTGSGNINASAS